MGERRSGEAGTAMYWRFDMVFHGGGQWYASTEPRQDKFEGKWFGGEEPEYDWDKLVLTAIEKKKEEHADYMARTGFQWDNVYWSKYGRWGTGLKLPREGVLPHFTDLMPGAQFAVGFDTQRYALLLRHNWEHCIGNLGEDHPTCKKARWYYENQVAPTWASFYEELSELGHFDASRRYGIKPRMSFVPTYQPEKKIVPGAYELYRSETYLEKYQADMSGEWNFPFCYVE